MKVQTGAEDSLVLSLTYSTSAYSHDVGPSIQVFLELSSGEFWRRDLEPSATVRRAIWDLNDLNSTGTHDTIVGVGISTGAFMEHGFRTDRGIDLASLYEISILPGSPNVAKHCAPTDRITNVHAEVRGPEKQQQVRLCWELTKPISNLGGYEEWRLPRSEITGVFSHFEIQIDEMAIGRAYALEMILPEMFSSRWKGPSGINTVIVGVAFGGMKIGLGSYLLRREEVDWEEIDDCTD
jgi:hypothetical protein